MTFVVGLIVGEILGFFFAILCVASARADGEDD